MHLVLGTVYLCIRSHSLLMHYLHRVDFSKSYLYQSLLVDSFLYLQAAVEEGIVVGGGCTLLRLSSKVDAIIETLENDEQKVGSKV